jgi:sulfur carrier protein
VITLRVNGLDHDFPASITLAALLVELELADRRIAVERNGEIVPRGQYGATQLAHGDQLEIVVAVGGG